LFPWCGSGGQSSFAEGADTSADCHDLFHGIAGSIPEVSNVVGSLGDEAALAGFYLSGAFHLSETLVVLDGIGIARVPHTALVIGEYSSDQNLATWVGKEHEWTVDEFDVASEFVHHVSPFSLGDTGGEVDGVLPAVVDDGVFFTGAVDGHVFRCDEQFLSLGVFLAVLLVSLDHFDEDPGALDEFDGTELSFPIGRDKLFVGFGEDDIGSLGIAFLAALIDEDTVFQLFEGYSGADVVFFFVLFDFDSGWWDVEGVICAFDDEALSHGEFLAGQGCFGGSFVVSTTTAGGFGDRS
jgi:hypothetical protein